MDPADETRPDRDDADDRPSETDRDEHLFLDIDVDDVIEAFPHGRNDHPPSESDAQAPG